MNAQRERCVAELTDTSCDSLVYGCLVAIMAQGPGEHRRVTAAIREQLLDDASMPAVVTSADALIEAIQALEARRVALVTPYLKPLAQMVVDYIEAEQIEVTDMTLRFHPYFRDLSGFFLELFFTSGIVEPIYHRKVDRWEALKDIVLIA